MEPREEEKRGGMTPYYQDSTCTIYHADCFDVLPTLETVDLLLTDPPYAPQTHEGARTGDYGSRALVDFSPVSAALLRDLFATALVARWIVATMDWRHIADLERQPPDGCRFVRFGIWVKPNGAPQFTGDRPATGWEGVGILHRDGGRMRWNGGGSHSVWTANKINSEHPTGKPISLFQQFVQLFSDPGATVLDPFMGGGTTLRAAKNLGRKAIGIEIEERYCEIAAKRLSQEVLALGAA